MANKRHGPFVALDVINASKVALNLEHARLNELERKIKRWWPFNWLPAWLIFHLNADCEKLDRYLTEVFEFTDEAGEDKIIYVDAPYYQMIKDYIEPTVLPTERKLGEVTQQEFDALCHYLLDGDFEKNMGMKRVSDWKHPDVA